MGILHEKFSPTKEIVRASEAYVNDYMRWRTFGFKAAGGLDDQEAEYIDALEICKVAYDMAELEAKQEQERREKAQAKKKPRRG